MNIEMALSYIFDLDRFRLSFGIFIFSELFNGEIFYQLSGSTFTLSRPGRSQGLLYKHLRH